jgi:hypothetical protein
MTPDEKKLRVRELKKKIGQDHAVIVAAEQGVQDLKMAAAPAIAELIKLTSKPGPHGIPVPDGSGGEKKVIASFRKDQRTFATSVVDASDLDD